MPERPTVERALDALLRCSAVQAKIVPRTSIRAAHVTIKTGVKPRPCLLLSELAGAGDDSAAAFCPTFSKQQGLAAQARGLCTICHCALLRLSPLSFAPSVALPVTFVALPVTFAAPKRMQLGVKPAAAPPRPLSTCAASQRSEEAQRCTHCSRARGCCTEEIERSSRASPSQAVQAQGWPKNPTLLLALRAAATSPSASARSARARGRVDGAVAIVRRPSIRFWSLGR
eukprot:scaffold289311_cov37-Tisochrysis_lutea.AAC.2